MLRHLSVRLIGLRQATLNRITVNQLKRPLISNSTELLFVRNKYVTSGVQGRRSAKTPQKKQDDEDEEINNFDLEPEDTVLVKDSEYEALASEALGSSRSIKSEQNVLIIQPYIKWGPKKSDVSPDIKLQEAEDLIRSLDTWHITESIKVPLLGFGKKTFFGRGKLDELKKLPNKYNGDINQKITCVFVSVSQLTQIQKTLLETVFGVPVMDRFSIVVQILRAHAKSRDAKLQIALAELPYIWQQMGTENSAISRSKLSDSQKMLLRNREKRIKNELEHIKVHRKMIRNRRLNKGLPVVAVVGYTNAGKTSLIKALTQQEKLEPQNKLFATLEVTAHPGLLPCNLQVLYIDTIGFMSDIPTELIHCFITTLEDALMADLIIHVQDMSHNNVDHQRGHVEATLRSLVYNSESQNTDLLKNVINVGNKCDLLHNIVRDRMLADNENESTDTIHLISCTTATGIQGLVQAIEENILKVTNRRKILIRVPQGGEELAWLYKNTAVTHTEMCERNSDYVNVHALITDLALIQFKNTFLKKTQ